MAKLLRVLPLLTLLIAASLDAQPAVEHPSNTAQPAAERPSHTVDTLTRLSLSGGVGIHFFSFDQRPLFTQQLDVYLADSYKSAATAADSTAIQKVPFQGVDLAFPIQLALRYYPSRSLAVAVGSEWMSQSQEALLLQKNSVQSLNYSLSAWSLYTELSLRLPERLLSVHGGDGLWVGLRRYWLPAAWIEIEWDGAKSEIWDSAPLKGSGWGLVMGSQFVDFGRVQGHFSLEWRSVRAISEQSWRSILPDVDRSGKARWSLGGIAAQLRLDWGVLKQMTTEGERDESPIPNTSSH